MIIRWLALFGVLFGWGDVRLPAQEDGPRFVIYYNSNASPASELVGLPYTHVIMAFVTLEKAHEASDAAGSTGPLPDELRLVADDRLQAGLAQVERLRADGKRVLISFGGGDMTEARYRSAVGREALLAARLADFVRRHGLDGVDLDFEVSGALHRPPAAGAFDGVAFLVALTRALRSALPDGALITHAPQAPYLDPAWHGGPYRRVLAEAGSAIDWITVQYYNNPDFELPIDTHLVGDPERPFPASYAGITRPGGVWPARKTLVGLPVYHADAANGYNPPQVVRGRILAPLMARYGVDFGGVTGWQFSTLTADHRYWNAQLVDVLRPGETGTGPDVPPSRRHSPVPRP